MPPSTNPSRRPGPLILFYRIRPDEDVVPDALKCERLCREAKELRATATRLIAESVRLLAESAELENRISLERSKNRGSLVFRRRPALREL
jgi:hypothetical protein